MALSSSSIIQTNHDSAESGQAIAVITIPSNLSHIFSFKLPGYSTLATNKDYWYMGDVQYNQDDTNSIVKSQVTGISYISYYGTTRVSYSSKTYYPACRFRYETQNGSKKLIFEITDNAKIKFGVDQNFLNGTWNCIRLADIINLSDILTVNSGYSATIPGTTITSDNGTLWSGSAQSRGSSVNKSITFPTAYKSVSTNKVLAFPSKEYYSFKSGINDLVKNNFSFQYTSGGSTTTLNSSYITVSNVSGSQYNKAVTITYNVPNPASTIDTDFANGILVPNTGVKLSTFYNTVAYNMASLNVAVTLMKSGNTFTVNSLPNPVWQYISSFALNVPVQAGGFSGTCTAFAQSGPFVNNYTVSYSGTITTWNQSVTSSMNQVCSISYSYQVSGNNTSTSKTFTVDRYYGYITSSTHLRMGVNFTGSSSLLYQSTAPTVEQLSSTSEIRSVTRL